MGTLAARRGDSRDEWWDNRDILVAFYRGTEYISQTGVVLVCMIPLS